MPRILGTILLMIFLLAGCGSKEPDAPAREGYAVDVGEPIATPTLPPALPPVTAPTIASPRPQRLLSTSSTYAPARAPTPSCLARSSKATRCQSLAATTPATGCACSFPMARPAGYPRSTYGWMRASPKRNAGHRSAVPAGVIPANAIPAQLLDVVDGETIKVSLAGASEELRYIGIDTPEQRPAGIWCGDPSQPGSVDHDALPGCRPVGPRFKRTITALRVHRRRPDGERRACPAGLGAAGGSSA